MYGRLKSSSFSDTKGNVVGELRSCRRIGVTDVFLVSEGVR
jgi:hypothetical protein